MPNSTNSAGGPGDRKATLSYALGYDADWGKAGFRQLKPPRLQPSGAWPQTFDDLFHTEDRLESWLFEMFFEENRKKGGPSSVTCFGIPIQ